MLLFNHSNAAWQMSTLGGADLRGAALRSAQRDHRAGDRLGGRGRGLSAGDARQPPFPQGYWTTLPILVFALAAFLGPRLRRQPHRAGEAQGGRIAGKPGGARVPHAADGHPLRGGRLRAAAGQAARFGASATGSIASHRRVRQHITSANSVIDLLLSNVAQHHRGAPDDRAAPHEQDRRDGARALPLQAAPARAHPQRTWSEDFEFRGSDLLMTHVLFNLMKNGFRAIEARGGDDNYLSIELKRGAAMNSVIVSDTGEGIPPEILNYVFIPFVSAQRPGVGTGLGLSFCRMIVEGCGGTISCRSEANAGTTFTIELPVVAPAVERAAAV